MDSGPVLVVSSDSFAVFFEYRPTIKPGKQRERVREMDINWRHLNWSHKSLSLILDNFCAVYCLVAYFHSVANKSRVRGHK